MDPQEYLLLANVLVWLGIGGYLSFLAIRQNRLEQRLNQMERLND